MTLSIVSDIRFTGILRLFFNYWLAHILSAAFRKAAKRNVDRCMGIPGIGSPEDKALS